MCGRFVAASAPDEVAAFFDAAPPEVSLPANFNVAPTNDVLAVVEAGRKSSRAGQRLLESFHWGLVPRWAKDVKIGNRMINARSEGIEKKNAFTSALRARRCLVPVDGFYEWKKLPGDPKTKQPYYIHSRGGEPLALAGLWERWKDPTADDEAGLLHSCTIITTDANEMMAELHDRMPVILPASAWDHWLDPGDSDVDALLSLLVPAPAELLIAHAVDPAVGNVRNRGAELLDPVTPAVEAFATTVGV